MKICPQCHDEYRDEITSCLRCHIELAHSVDGARFLAKTVAEAFDLSAAVKVFEGKMDACREIEGVLKAAKIACIIAPTGNVVEEGRLAQPHLTAKLDTYVVCVNKDKAEAYVAVMKARFDDMVTREHSKEFVLNDVNLDSEEISCPACAHVGALVEGACADCGLVLGVNEPA